MKIAVIIDQYDSESNGTTVSAARFVEQLRLRGHEVRIVATGNPSPGKYTVKERNFGIFNRSTRRLPRMIRPHNPRIFSPRSVSTKSTGPLRLYQPDAIRSAC